MIEPSPYKKTPYIQGEKSSIIPQYTPIVKTFCDKVRKVLYGLMRNALKGVL
jgi:hypothetical protein